MTTIWCRVDEIGLDKPCGYKIRPNDDDFPLCGVHYGTLRASPKSNEYALRMKNILEAERAPEIPLYRIDVQDDEQEASLSLPPGEIIPDRIGAIPLIDVIDLVMIGRMYVERWIERGDGYEMSGYAYMTHVDRINQFLDRHPEWRKS